MRKKKYPVTLTETEREQLKRLIAGGTAPARKLMHARILLKADQGPCGPGWVDEAIADAVDVSQPTVSRVRKQHVEEGLEAALNRRPPRREYRRKLDGAQEARLIAVACSEPPEGQARYFGTSLKGEANIDWDNPEARQQLLGEIVADADRLLALARQMLTKCAPDRDAHTALTAGAELLAQLLLQDIARTADGARIQDGVAADRLVSMHDPQMRHGRKSAAKRFDGHKAAVAVDPASQLITAATVLAGIAPDNEQARELVEQAEENATVDVTETIGDCAFGDGATRQDFAEAGRRLIAKVPPRPNGPYFPKEDFQIDPVAQTCVCPAGHQSATLIPLGSSTDRQGRRHQARGFRFALEICAACPLRPPKRGLCALPAVASGGRTSARPADAVGRAPGALRRAGQDVGTGPAGGHGGQPDAGRDEDGPDAWPTAAPRACPHPILRSDLGTGRHRRGVPAPLVRPLSLHPPLNGGFSSGFLAR